MKARTLVADDASFMREMIREIIEPEGFDVVAEAADGMEAVDAFNEHHPDLVTMDIVMPKKSGIEAVRSIVAPSMSTCNCHASGSMMCSRLRPSITSSASMLRRMQLSWKISHS